MVDEDEDPRDVNVRALRALEDWEKDLKRAQTAWGLLTFLAVAAPTVAGLTTDTPSRIAAAVATVAASLMAAYELSGYRARLKHAVMQLDEALMRFYAYRKPGENERLNLADEFRDANRIRRGEKIEAKPLEQAPKRRFRVDAKAPATTSKTAERQSEKAGIEAEREHASLAAEESRKKKAKEALPPSEPDDDE